MRGTLSLPEALPGWKNLFRGNTFSNIELDDSSKYRLLHTSDLFGSNEIYILCNNKEKPIKYWSFDHTAREISLTINESPSLIYSLKPIKYTPYFITPDSKIPASLQLSGSSRRFQLDGMEFKHKDYESVIHFRCPDDQLHTAILIAQLLFTPPMRENNG